MFNKRLMSYVGKDIKYTYMQVGSLVLSLLLQIVMIINLGSVIQKIFDKETISGYQIIIWISIFFMCLLFRYALDEISTVYAHRATRNIKGKLRKELFEKLLKFKTNYKDHSSTAELTQLCGEGVDQLDIYFSKYVPQFFYSLIAPIVLFITVFPISKGAAIALLVGVPLIPISIVVVQKIAKRLLNKYWGMYTQLGDGFLDNVRGLTTLKVLGADEVQNEKMNENSENFRKVTMRVLIMQLNSISVMDFVAFGGAAIGIVFALNAYRTGGVSVGQMFMMIMLSAEFFIPMRLLGSFFHVAMNGNAASKKIFAFLDLPIEDDATIDANLEEKGLVIKGLNFEYNEDQEVLKNVKLTTKEKGLYAFVGESGCGKSTLMSIISGKQGYVEGSVCFGEDEVASLEKDSLQTQMTVLNDTNYIFKGTIEETLLEGNPEASEEQMKQALQDVSLLDFVEAQEGLQTELLENAENLSGGQKQRLALARGLLHDTPVYIFDESTSNIDVESEQAIMEVIHKLAKDKLVFMVAHRLANVAKAKKIYVMVDGEIVEGATHRTLIGKDSVYKQMVAAQKEVESFGGKKHA